MPHIPVLLDSVIDLFHQCKITTFLDATVGAGGHARAILEHHPEIQSYTALDQDVHALSIAKETLSPWREKVTFHHTNFSEFNTSDSFDGILMDIGVSSMQIDEAERGFSFQKNGPLDMRMDQKQPLTAAVIVNTWSEESLGEIFRKYGEEKRWRRAAAIIVEKRLTIPFQTTVELVDALFPALDQRKKNARLHPLTRVFQALRIAVNEELAVLESTLPKMVDSLQVGGRLGVITFHSLEDRFVKQHFAYAASDKVSTSGIAGVFLSKTPLLRLMTRKPVGPSEEEEAQNPRSRSAKLRGVEKL